MKLIGISEMRARLSEVLDGVADESVTVLRRSRPVAILIAPERLEGLLEKVEDLEDQVAVLEAKLNPEPSIPWEQVRKAAG